MASVILANNLTPEVFMSVETLINKDPRLADIMQERNLLNNKMLSEDVVPRDAISEVKSATALKAEKEDGKEVVKPEPEPANSKVVFDNNQIRNTLEQINKVIPITNTRLVFEFDELGDPPIIKVIDRTNNELIREIPSQDFVRVAQAFSEMADNLNNAGALINFKA
ncbi:TPA: hypothetical protein DCX24_10725 [Candidatus Azambacteria bacterium]|nr:hypothetical protein [Rheinheimera sp.]HAW93142.1 hypothetical protein [Candidatus Azambacteria bacterium]